MGVTLGGVDSMMLHRPSRMAGGAGKHDRAISETTITMTPGSLKKSERRKDNCRQMSLVANSEIEIRRL